MRRETIRELTRAMPFVPFRVYLSPGETFEIRHPDMVVASPGAVSMAVPNPPGTPGGDERAIHLSLYHIQKIETLPTPATPAGANGTG